MRKSRSEASRRLYLRTLFKFCESTGKNPNELVKLRRKRAEKLVQEFADSIMGTSPRYSNLAIAILKAFFVSNGFKGIRALELETYHAPRRFRISHEYIPTKSEVYRMADSAGSLRDRAIILTLFSTGLRNSTLRAVLYSDIAEELNNNFANIMVPVYPGMKKIVPNACKGGIPYYSFTNEEASQAIKLYIRERLEKYGKIGDNEPLFTSEYNHISKDERKKKSLTSRQLQIIVKSAAKKAGIERWQAVHPHCLRKSFETVLHSQLIDGSNLDNEVQLFLIGHVLPGSQDPYFDSSKPDRLRIQYSKLKFGRANIENKFKVLKAAVARAFEDTDIDPEKAIEEYVKMKQLSQSGITNQTGR
ncbi:tyrosine-type recombinase/integrase [Candidatus Bathyarchaeota archaeon]|nr:tyrosine-type recombinase/integrase [Candidatus Bathyarchaeota archaeon]